MLIYVSDLGVLCISILANCSIDMTANWAGQRRVNLEISCANEQLTPGEDYTTLRVQVPIELPVL